MRSLAKKAYLPLSLILVFAAGLVTPGILGSGTAILPPFAFLPVTRTAASEPTAFQKYQFEAKISRLDGQKIFAKLLVGFLFFSVKSEKKVSREAPSR